MSAGIRAGSSNDGYVQVNGNDIITALSSGNVGIGNTSPSTKLHVNGTVTATNFVGNIGGTPEFSGDLTIPQWIIHAGDTDTKLGFPSADAVDIFAGGKQVRLTSDGHLGINRTTPVAPITARRLDAGGTGTNGVTAEFANSSGYGVWFGQSSASGAAWGATTGDFYWNTGGLSSQVERLRINSTGKVTVKSNAANSVAIALVDNDSSNEIWRVGQASDGDGYVEVLEDGGTVGCKLDASGNSFTMGNFGIGVASPSGNLEIDTASSTTMIMLDVSGTNFARIGHNSSSGTAVLDVRSEGLIRFLTGGNNERLRIDNVGRHGINVTNTGDYYSASDDLIIRDKDGGDSGITIRTGTANSGLICFADGASSSDNQYRRGQIRYHHNSDSMDFTTAGNDARMIIRSNGNVGIGNRTSNPGSLLHVHTASGDAVAMVEGAADAWLTLKSHAGDSQIRFADTASGSAGQIRFDHGTDNLFFEKGGSQRGKIASDGSTTWGPSSAGTSNMQWTKDTNQIPHFFWGQSGGAQPSDGCVVIGSPQTDICSQRVGTVVFGSTTSGGTGNTGVKASIECHTNASPGSDFNAGGNLVFQTKPNNSSVVERLRIKADSAILHTRSDNTGRHDVEFRQTGGISTGNWGGIKWTQGATGGTFLGGILISYHDTGRPDMVFYRRDGGGSGSAETLRLDRDGKLKLAGRSFTMGTQSDSGASVGIIGNAWGNNEIGIKMSHKVSGGQSFFVFYNTNGQVGYIQSSGSGTIYNTGSDYRLKENQVLISDGITRLKQLKPYRFNFKKDPSTTLDGFFAHEVQSVVPESIAGTKDEVATKDEGDRKKGDPILQGMDYGRITPLLTAALQEAIAKIEVLETKVAALESS